MSSNLLITDIQDGAASIQDTSTGIQAVVLMPIQYDVEAKTMASLVLAAQRYGWNKVRFADPEIRTLIDSARNRLLHRFYNNFTADRAIFLDADMGLPIGNLAWWRKSFPTEPPLPDRFGTINFFERLLSHDPKLGVIGAAYYDRKFGKDLQCSRGVGGEREPRFSDDFRSGKYRGLLPMTWVATGGLMIPRWVVAKLIENVDRWPEAKPMKFGAHYGFFSRYAHATGEDVAFGLRCKEIGITTYLDCDLRLLHSGERWM